MKIKCRYLINHTSCQEFGTSYIYIKLPISVYLKKVVRFLLFNLKLITPKGYFFELFLLEHAKVLKYMNENFYFYFFIRLGNGV